MANADTTDDLWQSVEQLVVAGNPREIFAALEAHPILITDRGDAALKLTEIFVTATQMPLARSEIADRRGWIELLRELSNA